MADFIPGRELSRLFFSELVQPALETAFPALRYDAALIDQGSEVLGFDTPMSCDHHWGPRVTLFLTQTDFDSEAEAIFGLFSSCLPYEFRGWPTSFEEIPGEPGTLRLHPKTEGPVNHRVALTTLRRFLQEYLNVDWQHDFRLDPPVWLSLPQQRLLTLTQGPVYHAGLGEVPSMQAQLAYFPRDVWLYLLAAGWERIGQEEHFVGRTGELGDEIGSRLVAGRLVRDLMMLCFLMERRYVPYAKWFGTAFAQLECSAALTPHFEEALAATNWRTREQQLCAAYEIVAAMHNNLGLTSPLDSSVTGFHGRGYRVIAGGRFAKALRKCILDPAVQQIAAQRPMGSLDQFSDSSDLREAIELRPRIEALYGR